LNSLFTGIANELANNDSNAVLEAFVDISTQLDEKSLQRLEYLIAVKKANSTSTDS